MSEGNYGVNEVLVGDARHIPLPDESVHLVMTSPPYWSLRDYGVPPSVWGGESECEHVWAVTQRTAEATSSVHWQHAKPGGANKNRHGSRAAVGEAMEFTEVTSGFCQRCGAWLGCLGLEPTPEEYIAHLVEVFREVRRVLRPDGVCVLNLGDSYAGSWGNFGARDGQQRGKSEKQLPRKGNRDHTARPGTASVPGLKPKDKCLIPHRVAMALQADGWYLRSDCVWIKSNPMPEAVKDRPTTAHEFIFLLTKSGRYWWDADAIRQPLAEGSGERYDAGYKSKTRPHADRMAVGKSPVWDHSGINTDPAAHAARGRNFRTSDLVLDDEGVPIAYVCATRGFPGAHFASFPRELVLPFVKAACPPKACKECGAGWLRRREKIGSFQRRGRGNAEGSPYQTQGSDQNVYAVGGWAPACECEAEAAPGVVLDPFAGSGTVGVVAAHHGRQFVGVDASPEYVAMANGRIAEEGRGMPLPVEDGDGGRAVQQSLF